MFTVVGAGIAGLASALALAPHGPVRVLERRDREAAQGGAGIQLAPNAMAALDALGLADTVRQRASAPDRLAIRTAGRARDLIALHYPPLSARYGAPFLTIARARLMETLLHAAEANGAIEIVYNTPASGDGEATLRVAADGVHSALRSRLIGDAPRDTGACAWRASGAPAEDHTELTMGPGYHLVRYPLAGQRDNLVLVTRGGRHPTSLRAPVAAALDGATGWTPWPIKVRPRHRYAMDNTAFVGDAAHAMTPYLAQGGAMALEDAVTLGAAVSAHGATPAALSHYAAARSTRVKRLARQSDGQALVYHLSIPASLVRDFAMARFGPAAVVKRMDWVWRWRPAPF